MDLYVYSDESGVFDKIHNKYYVFGGLVFTSKNSKNIANNKYLNVERTIRQIENMSYCYEVKATTVGNKSKGKLFRSLNCDEKFAIVIDQSKVFDSIFNSKKTKQRYLDWAYKYAIKKKFEALISQGKINPEEVDNIHFYVDQHTTATDGKYELKEALEQEFKYGTVNFECMKYYDPIFPNLNRLELKFCDSQAVALVRAADIVSNRVYHMAINEKYNITANKNLNLYFHP